ncbi:hypothetical protein EV401DRAFT_1877551 [Pisolithus croceorrhizus]|nr:hypothetical protein EV401DRAFT_1877551 [Pisolithus croceorrhizus]
MKCEFPEGATSCWRCTKSGYACIVEGRKSRNAPNKREYLLAQIRHKDQIIESLLKQLHNPYMATPLSISAFKMATSPSDKDNVKIADWMDRLQSSTKPPSQPCPSRTEMLRELRDSRNNTRGGGNNTMEDSDEVEEGGEATEGEETEKLTSPLPDAAVPIGLLANLSLDKDKGKSKARQGTGTTSTSKKLEDDDNNGVANKGYFMPGPANNLSIRKNLIEQHSPPDILLHGLVTAADVEKLFEIFWGRINPFISLLDPKIHTPTTIFQRCPFLFTVICAISSRYYDKSEIYPVAMHFAKHAAANALIDGWKSVELCQAYILMSIYIVPARRWEEDRSWLYTGLAIRIATDLNLHQAFEIQPTTERQERELLNRIRVWMICFNLDRSTATQFGKPSTIKEDHITRNGVNWYKESLHNNKYDIHLCGYTTLLRIVSQFHDDVFSDPDSPTGLNRSIDFLTVTLEHDNRLTLFFEEWTKRFNEESDHSDPGSAFRCKLLPFLVNYSRLVMYSFGFQHAFQRGMESNDQVFLQKCFRAATAVIEHMTEVLAPSGFMRSSPDGHFVFASFASAFLLKLLRPEFAQFLTHKMEDEIFELISRLITTLQELAIDERHTPHLYARFLADLLTKHRKGGAGISGHLQSHPPASQSVHKPPTQPRRTEQQYMPSPSSFQYSGLSSQESSHLRYDSDAMQMNTGSFSGTPRSPPPATTPPMPAANAPGPEYLGQPSLPLGVGSTDPADVGMDDILPDMGALASMRALNDVWWSNMMMPGFTWPDAPLMSSLHDGLPSAHQTAFPAFSAPETRVAM